MPKFHPLEGLKTVYGRIGRRGTEKNLYLQGSFPGLGQRTISLRTPNIKEGYLEAKRIERELLRQDPNYTPKTIGEGLLEIIELNRSTWGVKTREHAEYIINTRLIPVFGDLKFGHFRELHWKRYTEQFYRDYPNGKLFNTRKYLGKALRYAKRKGWIREEFDLPLCDRPTRRGRLITDDEIIKILDASKSQAFKLQVLLGRYMGMRKDEILGLTVSEVDLDTGIIHLQKPSSKTKRHKRDMAIAPEVLPALINWMGKLKGSHLFPAYEGKGRSQNNNATWRRTTKELKPHANFHDLRHTFITTKIHDEKKPIQDVSAYVGTSIAVLEKTYCHPTAEHTRHVVQGTKLRVVK